MNLNVKWSKWHCQEALLPHIIIEKSTLDKFLIVLLGLRGGLGCVINWHILSVGLLKPEILRNERTELPKESTVIKDKPKM